MTRPLAAWLGAALSLVSGSAAAAAVALVTAVSGPVAREPAGGEAAAGLEAFVRLNEGDRLSLGRDARVQILFFDGGRQENWRGAGVLRVEAAAAARLEGDLKAESRVLPVAMVRQIAKTPPSDGAVAEPKVRTRSMPSGGTLESIEKNYSELRKQADPADRNPEIYLLAGYFELKEFDKIDVILKQLADDKAADPEIRMLKSLYTRAIRNARSAAAK